MSTKVHIIDSMHTKTLALQKTKRFVVLCVGYTGNYVNYENNI